MVIKKPQVTATDFVALQDKFAGEVILPSNAKYDQSRAVYNLAIDRHPLAIAQCSNDADIKTCLSFVRQFDLKLSVKSSGHSAAGLSVCDDGLVIDLTNMKRVKIDTTSKTAWVQPGTSWKEFDAVAQEHCLAMPGGTVSSTSVSGFTMGGGLGWLMGSHGLACDNLLAAKVLLADGRAVVANENQNSDLLWALKGGGGNFGVVSHFKFQLHDVPSVTAGAINIPLKDAYRALSYFADLRTRMPKRLVICPTFLTNSTGEKFLSFDMCFNGSQKAADPHLRPILDHFRDYPHTVKERPYCEWQQIYDRSFDARMRGYWKTGFLKALDAEAIDTILAAVQDCPSRNTVLLLESFHGAYKEVGTDATAFGHRNQNFSLLVASRWPSAKNDTENIAWAKGLAKSIERYSDGSAYINYMGEGASDAQIKLAYGNANYSQLQRVKKKYDPRGMFGLQYSINLG